jgi:hypothetical protein
LVVGWEHLAWEKIPASVRSLLATVRAGVVVGRDGSSPRNTKSRIQALDYREKPPCVVFTCRNFCPEPSQPNSLNS